MDEVPIRRENVEAQLQEHRLEQLRVLHADRDRGDQQPVKQSAIHVVEHDGQETGGELALGERRRAREIAVAEPRAREVDLRLGTEKVVLLGAGFRARPVLDDRGPVSSVLSCFWPRRGVYVVLKKLKKKYIFGHCRGLRVRVNLVARDGDALRA